VSLPALPKQAFLPRRKLKYQERLSIIERRDGLFSLCTPAEQQCLMQLARWYVSYPHELLTKPNVFTESFQAVFDHRYFPFANPKPTVIVRGLAKMSTVIDEVERWHSRRSQARLIAYLRSLVEQPDDDVLLGVTHVLRVLPLETRFDGQRALEKTLDELIEKCAFNHRVPASKRFDALQRCIRRLPGPGGAIAADLRKLSWPLLLEVAHENMGSAVRLIDEHWGQKQSPEVLMSLHLHEAPELAYQLAVKFQRHRIEFAADMLRNSIYYGAFQLARLDQTSATALEAVIDASCRLLADWTIGVPGISAQSALRSMDHLLRFGNPGEAYWRKAHQECLSIVKSLDSAEQDKQLRLLAQVVFYGDSDPSVVIDAQELFRTCVARTLRRRWEELWTLERAVSDVCGSLSIVENTVLSLRNRRIAANPDHGLVRTVEGQLQGLLEWLLASEPSAALQHVVSLTLALSNETLIRKHHQVLRDEFEVRARRFPADAGLALKKLIQYCGYSQLDDEMYRRTLCRESFDALLPLLEVVAPADAAVARTGIGWSPRHRDI
jgi:hypothetical protein